MYVHGKQLYLSVWCVTKRNVGEEKREKIVVRTRRIFFPRGVYLVSRRSLQNEMSDAIFEIGTPLRTESVVITTTERVPSKIWDTLQISRVV